MKCATTVYNFVILNKITIFSDFQSWMKGVENATGTLKIQNIHDYNSLQTNFKLCNKEFFVEIVPIFPTSLVSEISEAIMYPDARPVIPISEIKLLRTTSRVRNGLQSMTFFRRKISQREMKEAEYELKSCIKINALHV